MGTYTPAYDALDNVFPRSCSGSKRMLPRIPHLASARDPRRIVPVNDSRRDEEQRQGAINRPTTKLKNMKTGFMFSVCLHTCPLISVA